MCIRWYGKKRKSTEYTGFLALITQKPATKARKAKMVKREVIRDGFGLRACLYHLGGRGCAQGKRSKPTRTPDTKTTQARDRGRKTFHPKRIN